VLNVLELNVKDRLSRWGVGPRIAVAALTYAAAGAATHRWPDTCRILFVPYSVFASLGGFVLVIGVGHAGIRSAISHKGVQPRSVDFIGVFALVRHPIYSAWIVFILPGLALLSRSWPVLLTPVVAYAVFKFSIRREDEYLKQRFGDAYLEYRARGNELIPVPKFWRRPGKAVQNAH